ncbi:MAG: hypothetical protein A3J24_01425 [Deltaproteobacteria bacterium RIFCSPLOWO2_02_FULL_53_8]|nr:MAG: hypothetical protein A3J24_01425 [Deltaproteobacteria bacterium RIFCSPLOWO2_02_FULL_53_8]
MSKRLKSYFITGLLVIVPLYITIYTLTLIVGFMEGAYNLLPEVIRPDAYLPFRIPGLGVLITLVTILFVGLITQNFIGKRLLRLGEKLLSMVPVVRVVYNASKQFMETFFSKEHKGFRKVALVEFPSRGMWSLGFITGKVGDELAQKTPEEMLNIFLPTTPNPTSGYYVLIPKREVIILDMSIEDAFKVIMTGGMITPEMSNTTSNEG